MRPAMTARAALAVPVVLAALADPALAELIDVTFSEPVLDRWMYPFNPTPGDRTAAPTFAALNEPMFDDRDAQFLIGFDTIDLVPTGEAPERYQITHARITATTITGNVFRYDPTYDPFTTYLPADDPDFTPDETPGRPIELYGVGYRNDFTAESFLENSPFGNPFSPRSRNAFATDYHNAQSRDISNNIEDRFDPVPFAIGRNDALTPGAFAPANTTFGFDLDLNNPDVIQYLRRSLSEGRLRFMISSAHPAAGGPDGGEGVNYPAFYTKENKFAAFGFAATLELTVELTDPTVLGDLNGDGVVNGADLGILITNWGPCPNPTDCPADLNNDGVVNGADLGILITNWTM